MSKIVFTYGTLFEDKIIKALFGKIPQNFYASLSGYTVYKGNSNQLPQIVKTYLISNNVDLNSYSYLFARQEPSGNIEGRAYIIDSNQELILDSWESYPNWYSKKIVTIKAKNNSNHKAFIYTLDIDGEKIKKFKRCLNDLDAVLQRAKSTREEVIKKFPNLFNQPYF
jgi:hypothetical protein